MNSPAAGDVKLGKNRAGTAGSSDVDETNGDFDEDEEKEVIE